MDRHTRTVGGVARRTHMDRHTRTVGGVARRTHMDRHTRTVGGVARRTHMGRHTRTVGGVARRTHTRSVPTMDGHLLYGYIFRVKVTYVLLDVLGSERGQMLTRLNLSHPGWPRPFYAKYVQTTPTPVHSRDAACPRPACLPTSWAIAHPTRRCASCLLAHVLGHRAPHAPMCVLPAHAPNVALPLMWMGRCLSVSCLPRRPASRFT